MFAIIIDILGAYLITKKFKSLWVIIGLAILVGWFASISANLIIYWLFEAEFTAGEIMIRIIQGMFWHPIFALVSALYFRPKSNKAVENQVSTESIEEKANKLDGSIEEFISFLETSPDNEEINNFSNSLLKEGYDPEGLVEIVRERLGSTYAINVEKAIL